MTTWRGQRAAPPLEWMRAVRDGLDLTQSRKLIAQHLATYARPDGSNAHPGWQKLAWSAHCSKSTVLRALNDLEKKGLIYCTERGSRSGRNGRANNYTLTLHDQLGLITISFDDWRKENL
jgi:Helix-turn-helix domain